MAKHYPNHDPFKELKFVSPFIPLELSYEIERPSPPSLEPKPCPSRHQNVVLDSGQDSTLILHDVSFKKENFYVTDISKAPTLETEEKDSRLSMEVSFLRPHTFHAQF
jgi:hypothetical protein